MALSVLMSVYYKENSGFLEEALESLLSQSVKADEIIIVEDGPLTQELYNVLDRYQKLMPEIKRIPLPSNQGLGHALNIGLNHCSHPLVARMDSDDICFPHRFEKQLDYMRRNPEIDVASGYLEEFEGDISNKLKTKTVPCTKEEIANYIFKRCPLNHPAVIFKKSAIEAVGGYQNFLSFEDWYLWVRLFLQGYQIGNLDKKLVHFRTSKQMYKRRGGWKYAKDNVQFQWFLYRSGLQSFWWFNINSIIRLVVSLSPNKIRSIFYTTFLRS